MKKRYLFKAITELALHRNKMAFISGPRQVGKTTLAKSYQSEFNQFIYKNWDESTFRRTWTRTPNDLIKEFPIEKIDQTFLLILDEIHKAKGWRQTIKGFYDHHANDLSILVTGSARMDTFKKGGDSLMGRYLNFRLHPFSVGEICGTSMASPDLWLKSLFKKPTPSSEIQESIQLMWKHSGFPEPFLAHSPKITNLWSRNRNEKLVREDLRDLSRLPELSQVEMLTSLLPEKVGSPLSIQSLREDLGVAHDTVSRWLLYLEALYYFFELKPWSKSLPRSLKKEGKIYLFDWTGIVEQGARFENLVAAHLLKACHYWTDVGEGKFNLNYVRNKEKQEVDFIIIKNNSPWLMIEVKLSNPTLNQPLAHKFMKYFKCPYIQIINEPNIYRQIDDTIVMSDSFFLKGLP